jgi:hypothetical protein
MERKHLISRKRDKLERRKKHLNATGINLNQAFTAMSDPKVLG